MVRYDWPDNLEAHNKIVAAILKRLLAGGITRTTLSVDDFRSDFREAGYPEPADIEGLFDDILIWLKDEGIIRFQDAYSGSEGESVFPDCVITGHGMDLLRRKADVLGGKTAADVIMSATDQNASASQLVKIGGLIGGLIGGFTKAAS